MHSILCQTLLFLKGNQDTSRAPNNNKQPCSCQTSLRNLLFHLVQRISLHFKSTDLYLFCTTKVFPKFLLPFESQASFQSEEFGSYDYAPRSLSLVACSLPSCVRACSCKKTLVHKIKVIFSLFISHNANVAQRSSMAKTRQKRLRGELQKSLNSVSCRPMWCTFFFSVTDKTCWLFTGIIFKFLVLEIFFAPGYSGVFWWCSGGVPGCSRDVPGCFGSVVGCSEPVPGFTDTPFYWLKSLKYLIRSK